MPLQYNTTPLARSVSGDWSSENDVSGSSHSYSLNNDPSQTKPGFESTADVCEKPLSGALQVLIKSNPLVDLTGQVALEHLPVAEGGFGLVYRGTWKNQPVCFLWTIGCCLIHASLKVAIKMLKAKRPPGMANWEKTIDKVSVSQKASTYAP